MTVVGDNIVISRNNFWLKYSWPEDFARFTFLESTHRNRLHYIGYRFIVFVYFFGWLVRFGIIFEEDGASSFFFIYVTSLTFVLLSIFNLLAFIVAILRDQWEDHSTSCRDQPDQWQNNSSYIEMVLWSMNETVVVGSILLSLNYWAFVYDYEVAATPTPGNLHVHGINVVFMIVDLFISAYPWRLFHFWIPTVYALSYATFTGIYYESGGLDNDGYPYIYSILNFNDPEIRPRSIGILFGVVFIGTPVIHACVYGLYRQKIIYYSKKDKVADTKNSIPTDISTTALLVIE